MWLRCLFGLPFLVLALGAAPSPGVDGLVAKHVEALGGIDRIHALHTFIKHGWYEEGTVRLNDMFIAQMRPFYRVIGDPRTHPLDEIHEGYDGSPWEFYPDPGIVVRTVGAAARTSRHTALFDDPLVEYRRHGTSVDYGGTETFHGHPVYVLHTHRADGFAEDYMLDQQTFMLDGRRQIVPMHAFGKRYVTDDVYGDYRAEGGIMFAHSDAEIDAESGKVLDRSGVTSMEINPDLQLSIFSPPSWNRTPLQQMIQRIYDERDEPASAMATYRDFSSIVDIKAPATGDAIDFTAYQCLKMGHTDTALTLLTQNVADHPDSARAHFGLARALDAAGEKEKARDEFARAHAIDPSVDRRGA